MTTQIPDSCTFMGRKWEIIDWSGNYDCIPKNQALGFETKSPHTANWSGRIDHFLVCHGKLFLFKIEVVFAEISRGFLPDKARREVILRYEWIDVLDTKKWRRELREHRTEYLIYDDLVVPYTGSLFLRYPYEDEWNLPSGVIDEGCETAEQVELNFVNGMLTDDDLE